MKKALLTLLAALLSLSLQAATPATPATPASPALAITVPSPTTPHLQLVARMAQLQRRGIMIGHQDDPLYGHSWAWDHGRSDVKEVTGSYPAVMGFELGWLEVDSLRSLDKVPFDRIRTEAIAQHRRGGIVTFSWHPINPLNGKSAWDPMPDNVASLLPGHKDNAKLQGYLDRLIAFFQTLKDNNGHPIPFIFRPWHEMSGGWFWWGSKSCTPDEYKALYRYTHDYIQAAGFTNIVWAYSPNYDNPETLDKYLTYYPGNGYVDLLGVDLYDFNHDNDAYASQVRNALTVLTEAGRQTRKLIAFSETGQQQLPEPHWFTSVLWPAISAYPITYVLFWRNAWDNPKETYVPYRDHATESDFKAFARLPRTLFLNDIAR